MNIDYNPAYNYPRILINNTIKTLKYLGIISPYIELIYNI